MGVMNEEEVRTLEARRQLIREAQNEGYLRAAEDLEAGGPEAVRRRAKQLREDARVP